MTYVTQTSIIPYTVGMIYVSSIHGKCAVVDCQAYSDGFGYKLTLKKMSAPSGKKISYAEFMARRASAR